MLTKISPCLWFDGQAEDAARFYTGIFKNSKIVTVARFPGEGVNSHGHVGGSVMAVEFELEGISFSALNGGPHFRFSPAVSFQIDCESQEEVDYFWDRLGEGGDPAAQQCGWLADKFGLSWQVVPAALMEMLKDADPARRQRVFNAMLQMKRLCIADLRKAYSATS